MLLSSAIVGYGIWLSLSIYRKARPFISRHVDPLEITWPRVFAVLSRKFLIDEIYDATVVRLTSALSKFCDWLDRNVWSGVVQLSCGTINLLAAISRTADDKLINSGFDESCETVRDSSWLVSKIQNGQIQRYMRAVGVSLCVIVMALLWGCR
jgi:NADH:ubiquinone oxidoreductase subunit 5 (subunit L)/multisubunit Na+/H+ antiporter MnhA subunit